jgi:hypothetical protein
VLPEEVPVRRTSAVVAVISLALLGGCSGSDSPSPDRTTRAPDATDQVAEFRPCQVLSAKDVGAIVGGTVTADEDPNGGCLFNQEDPRAPSAGISGVVDVGGGFEASRGGNATDGKVADVPGVGDDAWIAIGRTGGANLQGQGAVAVGDQLVNVTVLQGKGLDRAAVKEMTIDLMRLAASKA